MATRSKRSSRMPSHRPSFLHATCLISPRGLIQHHHAAPQLLLLLAAFAIGATCVLAGCGTRLAPQHSPSSAAWAPAPSTAPVRFDPSMSYDDALRAITDLGLQPSVACGYEADLTAGRVITDMQWQPAGQRSIFVREHRLFVTFTPLAAPDWGARLTHVHGFVRNTEQQWDQGLYCPDLGSAAAYPTASLSLHLTRHVLLRPQRSWRMLKPSAVRMPGSSSRRLSPMPRRFLRLATWACGWQIPATSGSMQKINRPLHSGPERGKSNASRRPIH